MTVPLVLITGYLGAGKTTLLRNLLDDVEGRRVAVLMNEFGEIGIDGTTVSGDDIDMIEMAGGCVCCSITGELEAAIEEVVESVDPEMIVLETTGVAEPGSIVGLVDTSAEGVRIDSIVTVVDADALARSPHLGHTGQVQIEMADVLLLNKTDLVDEESLDEIEEGVRELNSDAPMYRTVKADIEWDVLLGLHTPREVHEHDEHEVHVGHFALEPGEMDEALFEEALAGMPGSVYRLKGFVELDGRVHLVNYVNGRWEMETIDREPGKLVFIGEGVEDDRERIEELIGRCGA